MKISDRWKKIRVLVLAVLLMPAAYLVGNNLGYRQGIQAKIGGPGEFTTAAIEWHDPGKRKVVVYLNDGANGYSFWMTLNPAFVHYTSAAKVFTCDNTNPDSIRQCLDKSRAWARDDWEGHDSRIVGGELKPRADEIEEDGFVVVSNQREAVQDGIRQTRREEVEILRKQVNRMALEIENLKLKLERK